MPEKQAFADPVVIIGAFSTILGRRALFKDLPDFSGSLCVSLFNNESVHSAESICYARRPRRCRDKQPVNSTGIVGGEIAGLESFVTGQEKDRSKAREGQMANVSELSIEAGIPRSTQ